MLKIGYAAQDITPAPGITLSGFALRRNQPSEGVDDPLELHAMVVDCDGNGDLVLLIVFDLLGLGVEMTEAIHQALDTCLNPGIPRDHRVFCCTHTHSAPAVIPLLGCGIFDPAYGEQVVDAAVQAAKKASRHLYPAVMRVTTVQLPGISRNRRNIMPDGSVAMTALPGDCIIKHGPTLDTMTLVRFDTLAGNGIVAIANWACHPATVCTQNITADFPGELRRQLSTQWGLPFVFMQGACGNLNPEGVSSDRQTMLQNVALIMARLRKIDWPEPISADAGAFTTTTVSLPYDPLPDRQMLTTVVAGMECLANTGTAPDATMGIIADILNAPPDQLDSATVRYFAGIMAEWARSLLEPSGKVLPSFCDLAVATWRLGPLVCCFIAAEAFAETALSLQEAFPERMVLTFGYASPLVGYLPTDSALDEGGYESAYAYRFYTHPAPFAHGSEGMICATLEEMIRNLD